MFDRALNLGIRCDTHINSNLDLIQSIHNGNQTR